MCLWICLWKFCTFRCFWNHLILGSLWPRSPPNGRHYSKCPVDGSYYKRYNYPLMWPSIVLSWFFPCRNFYAKIPQFSLATQSSCLPILTVCITFKQNKTCHTHLYRLRCIRRSLPQPYNNSLGSFIHIPARRHHDEKPPVMFRIINKVSKKRFKHGNSAVYFLCRQYLTGVS